MGAGIDDVTSELDRDRGEGGSDPLHDEDRRPSELEELRRLLLPTERERLEHIESRVEGWSITARDVGAVIADAIVAGGENDPEHLDDALQEPVARSMRRSVREDPASIADALFPVMGPAIRRAIIETVRGMLESTNRAIEASLSWQGLRWRLEAWRSGKSFAEIALLHSLVYRVEQLLLIHRESGLLLHHVVAPEAAAQDPDMVSGMLTAIRDFVRDSFGAEAGESLDVSKVGELQVLVEESPHAALAAVVRGHPPAELRTALQEALEGIEGRCARALASFDGDVSAFAGVKELLEPCLRAHYEERRPRGRGAVALVWALVAVLALGSIGWLLHRRSVERRWSSAIAALDQAPGIVVTGVERRSGTIAIKGLRDPDAEDPSGVLAREGVDPRQARLAFEPYQSLDPVLVAGRRREAARSELDALASRIETIPILMPLDSADIVPESLVWLPLLSTDLDHAVALGREAESPVSIEIIGHTDLSGDEQRNEQLSEQRAERVRDLLIERGLPSEIISARGVAARDFVGSPDSEEDLRRNRRVDVRLSIGSRVNTPRRDTP